MLNKLRKNKKGFTLIELIVVIAILGILAAVLIPRLSGFTNTAKLKANVSNIQSLQSVIRVYEANEGSLPDNIAKLQTASYFGADVTPKAPQVVSGGTGDLAAGNCSPGQAFLMHLTTGDVTIGTPDSDHLTISQLAPAAP